MEINLLVVDPNIKTRNAIEALCEYHPQVASVYAVPSPSEARALLTDRCFDYAVVRTDIYEESGYDFAEQMIFGGFIRAVSFIGDETDQELSYMPLGFFPGKSLRTEVPEMIAKYQSFETAGETIPTYTGKKPLPKSRILLVEAQVSEQGNWSGTIGPPDGKAVFSFRGWDELLLKIDDICDLDDFPKKDRTLLCFSEAQKWRSIEISGNREEGESGTENKMMPAGKKKLHFKIQITSRCGGSLQGVAVLQKRKLTVHFVSALQLLRLFGNAAELVETAEQGEEETDE